MGVKQVSDKRVGCLDLFRHGRKSEKPQEQDILTWRVSMRWLFMTLPHLRQGAASCIDALPSQKRQ
jgi:hypothetical protein